MMLRRLAFVIPLALSISLVACAAAPDEEDADSFDLRPTDKDTNAKVILGDPPAKDGDPLSARIVIEFADGDVLAETITAPVKSAFGACPSSG